MNSFDPSGENKEEEKNVKVFTPNIYRKPVVSNEREKIPRQEAVADVQNDIQNNGQNNNVKYVSAPETENGEPVYRIPVADIEGLIQKESQLAEIRTRYESGIAEYEEKQKKIDELKEQFSDLEKDLKNKCSILSSAIKRAEKAESKIPADSKKKSVPDETGENNTAEIEKGREEIKAELKQLKSSREEYEKQLAEHNTKMEELGALKSAYETEYEEYMNKRSELDGMCRELEQKLSDGEDLSLELKDKKCIAALEVLKSNYYNEFKELNHKRVDIETLRSRLEDEERIVNQKRSSIDEIKEHVNKELVEIGPKAEELEASLADYDERMKILEEKKSSYDAEETAIKQKREENTRLKESMERSVAEMERKRKELEEMIEKTNEEIGIHATIHRQHIDIRKLNNKLEQQTIYIQNLETSIAELKRELKEAKSDVKKNEVFSLILKQNLELMR
jgi:chromosome segregation ATPase